MVDDDRQLEKTVLRLPLTELKSSDKSFFKSMKKKLRKDGKLPRKHCLMARVKLKKYTYLLNNLPGKEEQNTFSEPAASLHKKTIRAYFNTDAEIIKSIKGMGGDYRKTRGYWGIPLRINHVEELKLLGFKFDENLASWYKKNTEVITDDSTGVNKLDRLLRPYQRIGVNFIDSRDGNVLIADSMGLGKTIETIGYLIKVPEALPVTVVCPSTIKYKWQREVLKWTDYTVKVINGIYNPRKNQTPDVDILIVNYSILHYTQVRQKGGRKIKTKKLRRDFGNFKTLILDEAHYIKNKDSLRSEMIKKLAKGKNVIALTGTPVQSKPIDAYNILRTVNHYVIPNFWEYAHTYCNAKYEEHWDLTGASNTKELNHILTKTIMLRRTKEEVLNELPGKERTVIPLDWTNSIYKKALKTFHNNMNNHAVGFGETEALKQAAVEAKLPEAVTWIKDFLEENDKIVLFTRHKATVKYLGEQLNKYNPVFLTGNINSSNRIQNVDKFQTDNSCRIFIGNMQAAGEGIDLTASSAVAFLEIGWTPSEHNQCEDRAHRIGQKDSVICFYLVAEKTVEDDLCKLIDRKRKTVKQIIDGADTSPNELLKELLEKYKRQQ